MSFAKFAQEKDAASFRTTFQDAIQSAIADELEQEKLAVAQSMFGSDHQLEEEVEQIDELNKELGSILNRYIRGATDGFGPRKGREAGVALALRKKWGNKEYGLDEPKVKAVHRPTKEEVEQIDEISKEAKAAYMGTAVADLASAAMSHGENRGKKRKPDPALARRIRVRQDGIYRATKDMRKEEVDQIDEGVSDRMGEKIAAARTDNDAKNIISRTSLANLHSLAYYNLGLDGATPHKYMKHVKSEIARRYDNMDHG